MQLSMKSTNYSTISYDKALTNLIKYELVPSQIKYKG